MARVLFAKGVRGEIPRKLQLRLTELGFNPGGIDGDYGDNTRKAVRAFQKQSRLTLTGEVDVTTWKRLTGRPVPSVRDRSLQLTAAFEGHDFTLAQGNYDGAGVTWGIIGFTLTHGSLGAIVLEVQRRKPALVAQAFGPRANELLRVVRASKAQQLTFADSISLGASKEKLAEPWRSAFRRFGELDEVQAVQIALADRGYFRPAVQTARALRLKSELGIALAFDIHVQNGSVSARAREQVRQQLAQHPVDHEREVRVIIANAVANQSRPQFREDVRSRKLTIATGAGAVHGSTYVLRNWGLADVPAS
jgi:peptidoglycan hydrolase-like protein with peptidoglycan-binding domain